MSEPSEKERILQWIANEKNAFSQYKSLCANFGVVCDPQAEAVHQGRLEVMETFYREFFP